MKEKLGIRITIRQAHELSTISYRCFYDSIAGGFTQVFPGELSEEAYRRALGDYTVFMEYADRLQVYLSVLPPFTIREYFRENIGTKRWLDADFTAYLHWAKKPSTLYHLFYVIRTVRAISDRCLTACADSSAALLNNYLEKYEMKESEYHRMKRQFMDNSLGVLLQLETGVHHRSCCLFSENFIKERLLSENAPSQDDILCQLQDFAVASGPDYCLKCPFRRGTPENLALLEHLVEKFPHFILPRCLCKPEGIRVPKSRSTISRIRKLITPSMLCFAQNSRQIWEAKYGSRCVRERPELVNEGWAIDFHEFDVYLWDEISGQYRRPWVVMIIDLASGAILGSTISYRRSALAVQEAFCRACCVTVDSPFHGLPKHIISDHGSEFTSRMLMELLDVLQVDHTYIRCRSPWSNPIERTFGTIEKRWIRRLPGYCGGKREQKKGKISEILQKYVRKDESGKRICLLYDIETFATFWFRRVVSEFNNYSCRKHKTPLERYNELPHADTCTPSWAVAAVLLSPKCSVLVRQDGIRFGKVRYDDPVLKDYIGERVFIYGYETVYPDAVCAVYVNKETGIFRCLGEICKAETLNFFEPDRMKLARTLVLHNLQVRKVSRDIELIHTIASAGGGYYSTYIRYCIQRNEVVPMLFSEELEPRPGVETSHLSEEFLRISLWICTTQAKLLSDALSQRQSS